MNDEYIGIIELDEGVLTIVKRDNKLIAGTVCNVGLLEHYNMDYDYDFSLDENLQSFIEEIKQWDYKLNLAMNQKIKK